MNDIENMLKQLQESYIAEFPEKVVAMETLILKIDKDKDKEDFRELYRQVHSHKGSAGTYGYHYITSICHQFENELNDYYDKLDILSREDTKNWLAYLDLLNFALEKSDSAEIDQQLGALRTKSEYANYTCLLVDTRSAMLDMVTEILSRHSIDVVYLDDGYIALGRILVEKFDLIICGKDIAKLSGPALIAAVKTSSTANKNTPTVLLTSAKLSSTKRLIDPDYIVKKNTRLPAKLNEVCDKILKTINN